MRSSAASEQLPLPLPGVTCDIHDAMLWRAGGRCEICRVLPEEVQKGPLHIDHDHRLGTGWDHVRGLLCSRCNNQMKYVDNGHRKPTPEQLKYIANSWFWTLLPPDQIDQPYFPEVCEHPNQTVPYDSTPTYRRRQAALALAEQEGRTLRRTSAGTVIWW